MLLADVVATSALVASTRSRTTKIAALADLLRRATEQDTAAVVGFLTGIPRQGRIGVGWASVGRAGGGENAEPTVTVGQLDDLVSRLGELTGAGSVGLRSAALSELLARATPAEADFVRLLFTGQLRQGALEGIMVDAVAASAGLPAPSVRRALMMSGDLGAVATLARNDPGAISELALVVGRPLRPMLASTAEDLAGAMTGEGLWSVEAKLDGARIQLHRSGSDITVFTRNLNDVTGRLPEVVASAVALPGGDLVLDGEIVGLAEDTVEIREARSFQETMSRFGTHTAPTGSAMALTPFWFDCLHAGGDTLLDAALTQRRQVLEAIVGSAAVPAVLTNDVAEAQVFLDRSLAQGHEGVMVKDASSSYVAGRRGKAWRKVKPVRTVDLVVLGAEWGHGRRQGWLSNLHLGARRPGEPGQFVMVGKTFKGLTDKVLAEQTTQLLARQTHTSGITVFVRPELVVEIALDGVQVSTRYLGGVALRFARVRRYRPDKSPEEADTIDTVRALLAANTSSTTVR